MADGLGGLGLGPVLVVLGGLGGPVLVSWWSVVLVVPVLLVVIGAVLLALAVLVVRSW